MTLGVSQTKIETEYYMVDLAEVIRKKQQRVAAEKMDLLQLINSRYLDKADYKKLVDGLLKIADVKQKQDSFDREAMDALHAFTARMKQ